MIKQLDIQPGFDDLPRARDQMVHPINVHNITVVQYLAEGGEVIALEQFFGLSHIVLYSGLYSAPSNSFARISRNTTGKTRSIL